MFSIWPWVIAEIVFECTFFKKIACGAKMFIKVLKYALQGASLIKLQISGGVTHASAGRNGAAGGGGFARILFKLVPGREMDEVQQQEIANDQQ